MVELELPARPEVVSVARLVVGALVATDPLFDEERGADLRLAVSEACTNAIQAQAAAGPADPAPIQMRFVLHDGRIEIAVTDHGRGFDPEALREHPEVTDPARLDYEGGLGIPLIKMLSDDLTFDIGPDGTTVTMVFGPRTPGSATIPGPAVGSGSDAD